MIRSHHLARRVAVLAILACTGYARSAVAGPPLLIPFDIGSARSLPWAPPQGRSDYDRAKLIADTEAVLSASDSPIVHMETLRRAAFYARTDGALLSALLTDLTDRATRPERGGPSDALADLDTGYFVEVLRQMKTAFTDTAPVASLTSQADGYAWMTKAIATRPTDPTLQFAAALIASNRHREQSAEHARRARAGATTNPELAKNLDHLDHLEH